MLSLQRQATPLRTPGRYRSAEIRRLENRNASLFPKWKLHMLQKYVSI